ncbi:MAG: hypothetical protein B6U87_00445 [Candidatus Aenigmarchaeota archaeon ex4484_52]|nr:MAG: hypothetical protein B6U87_00445 [Candidatus Aenigmarchaeota archaeon ex4484_52]
MQLLLIKYAELWLKSEKIKRKFSLKLKKNIEDLFFDQNIKAEFLFKRDYILVKADDVYREKIKKCLSFVCGIEYFCFAKYCKLSD